MTAKNPPSYHLDDDTEELVETVLTWAQELCDLQKDEDVRDEMISIVQATADRFNIQQNTVTIEETEQENGDIHLKIRVEREDRKPRLEVIENDNIVEFKKNTDDEDNGGGTLH